MLREILDHNGPGPVSDSAALVRELQKVWDDFEGASETAMEAHKLNRIENPHWDPPVLRFGIERHGALVGGGSTRDEVQAWEMNLDTARANIVGSKRRQSRPTAPRLDVKPLAEEIAKLAMAGADDDRLKWSADRNAVTVRIGKVIPDRSAFAQTVRGRRERFRSQLDALLSASGWSSPTYNRYVKATRHEPPDDEIAVGRPATADEVERTLWVNDDHTIGILADGRTYTAAAQARPSDVVR
jgi:hypothetical protein